MFHVGMVAGNILAHSSQHTYVPTPFRVRSRGNRPSLSFLFVFGLCQGEFFVVVNREMIDWNEETAKSGESIGLEIPIIVMVTSYFEKTFIWSFEIVLFVAVHEDSNDTSWDLKTISCIYLPHIIKWVVMKSPFVVPSFRVSICSSLLSWIGSNKIS